MRWIEWDRLRNNVFSNCRNGDSVQSESELVWKQLPDSRLHCTRCAFHATYKQTMENLWQALCLCRVGCHRQMHRRHTSIDIYVYRPQAGRCIKQRSNVVLELCLKCVLSSFLETAGLAAAARMSAGGEFHTVGPACDKARSLLTELSSQVAYLFVTANRKPVYAAAPLVQRVCNSAWPFAILCHRLNWLGL